MSESPTVKIGMSGLKALRTMVIITLAFVSLSYAIAFEPPPQDVTVRFDQVDVDSALQQVMMNREKSFIIDPALKGKVSADLRNETLEKALEKILDQVRGTFFIDSGVYCFAAKSTNYRDVFDRIDQNPRDDKQSMRITRYTDIKNGPRVSLQMDRMPLRTALKDLFKGTGIRYQISPDLQGIVSVECRNATFTQALHMILDNVRGTYRIMNNTYMFIRRNMGDPFFDPEEVYTLGSFIPGEFTSAYEVKNPVLYLAKDRTFLGTYLLLKMAAKRAGASHPYVQPYGDNGFAMPLVFDHISRTGKHDPLWTRFEFIFVDWFLDFRKIASYWTARGEDVSFRYRILVLVVSTDAIKSDGMPTSRPWQVKGDPYSFPESIRSRVWTEDPKLRVLVYEIETSNSVPPARLLMQSKIKAQDHVIDSGLWTAKHLK